MNNKFFFIVIIFFLLENIENFLLNNLEEYYKKRAFEYEKIYFRDDPIRLEEQHLVQRIIKNLFKDKMVLEIAAGTGYWTQYLSETARKKTEFAPRKMGSD